MKKLNLMLLLTIAVLFQDVSSNTTKNLGPDEIKEIYHQLKIKLDKSLIKLNEIKALPQVMSKKIDAKVDEALAITSQLSDSCKIQARTKLEDTRGKFQRDLSGCSFIIGMYDNIKILVEDGEILVEGLMNSVFGSIKNELSCLNSSNKIECFAAKTVNASAEIALDSFRVGKFAWQIFEFELRTIELFWSCFTHDILVSEVQSTLLESYRCHKVENSSDSNAFVKQSGNQQWNSKKHR